MLFSVVIPVYNRECLIHKALDSVFAQTFTDYEVIVIDDGSTDQTCSVLESYGDQIRLLRQENRGPGVARNRGAKASKGKYVAFLDSDDQWFPWTLATYAEVIRRCGEPAFVKGARIDFTEKDALTEVEKGDLTINRYRDFLEAAGCGKYVSSCIAVVKRTALDQVGGFTTEDINAEDHDLALRLGTQPGFVEVKSPPQVAVRRHDGQVTENLSKTAEGLTYLLDREEAGTYPGGNERRRQRLYLLCQHIRGTSLSLAREGYTGRALEMYRRTLSWQVSFGRVKYILGFPVVLGLEWLSSILGSTTGE